MQDVDRVRACRTSTSPRRMTIGQNFTIGCGQQWFGLVQGQNQTFNLNSQRPVSRLCSGFTDHQQRALRGQVQSERLATTAWLSGEGHELWEI